jgi:steroid delta-isomerase-like uncharacterized protein
MIFYNSLRAGRGTFGKNKQMKSVAAGTQLLWVVLLLPGTSLTQETNHHANSTKRKEVIMSTIRANKEVIRKLYEQSLNTRNMELLQDLIAEDYVGAGGQKGIAGFKAPLMALIEAFPDAQWKVEELIGEGDKVVVKHKVYGTHRGPFQHLAATGKSIASEGIAVYTLKDGKIINNATLTDRLGFLQQLELLPLDLTLLSRRKVHKNQVSFIDKFFVPSPARQPFYERMRINRNFIKNLPGFIEDAVYEHTDEKGNLICITVAKWESKQAVDEAKQAVQAEYKRQGFDPAQMFEQLGILMERAIYRETASSN